MNFYPTYQPYQYQDQLSQLRNSPMMPMSGYPAMQNRQDSSGVLWVQGEAGAKSWIVTPGTTVLLMDSEAQRFYLKSADANGVPTMRVFEYKEVVAQKPTEAASTVRYVTAEEFDRFKNEVLGKLEKPLEEANGSVKGANNE